MDRLHQNCLLERTFVGAITLIVIDNALHAQLIAAKAGVELNPQTDRCVARVKDGKLLGGVVYSDFTERGGSISMHMAGFQPGWADRTMVWAAFFYPFVQLDCQKVFGRVREDNRAALDYNIRLGFKVEFLLQHVYKDCGMFLLSMYRDECRWLERVPAEFREADDGQEGRTRTA